MERIVSAQTLPDITFPSVSFSLFRIRSAISEINRYISYSLIELMDLIKTRPDIASAQSACHALFSALMALKARLFALYPEMCFSDGDNLIHVADSILFRHGRTIKCCFTWGWHIIVELFIRNAGLENIKDV